MYLTKQRLDLLGNICGILGVTLCILAVVVRFKIGGGNPAGVIIAPRNIFLGGIAVMVFGCWLKLTAR
ncbi:MAG: hypothetical protein ACYS0G_08595 [Planctomycetota bacterium]|jgi:hypothetical protein